MTMNSPRLRLLPLLLAACSFGAAHAGRPLASETADALPARQCEVEMGSALESDKDTPSSRHADVVFSCGVLSNTQAAIGLSRSRAQSQSAYGTTLTGKTMLWAAEEGKPGFGVRYGAAWTKLPGEGGKLEEIQVLAIASQEVAKDLWMHANLGWSRAREERITTTNWSLGIETVGDWSLAADVFGDDRGKPWVSAGIGYTLGHGVSVNVSLARQMEEPRGRVFTLGLKMVF